MAGTTLDVLPPAVALSGGELVWLYQPGLNPLVTPWIGVRCTTQQIANLLTTTGGFGVCSMRQLFAAMAAAGVMVTAFEALPGDITNSSNIAWNHAYRMIISDPFITGFLQPAIGYTNAQMTALFAAALSYPI
jgi:hypothetical protein